MRSKYITKQRRIILKYLNENPHETISAKTLYEALKTEGYNIGKATVYRHIQALHREGYLKNVSNDSGGYHYNYIEDPGECDNHWHLKCIKCGEFVHLDCGITSDFYNHVRDKHRFSIDLSASVLSGLCDRCK